MNRTTILAVTGTILGGLLFTWLGPKAIGWWFQPPVPIGVDCRSATEWAMNKLIVVQGVGMAFGLISGLALAFAFRSGKTSKAG